MRVLIAEDEKDMQRIIRLYLEKEGYEVTTVSDGQAALEELCASRYDLAVLDWMMPLMDGISVCRAVRESAIPVKIIMLTAKGEVESEIMGLTVGADDYIKKPFEPKLLILRIKKLLQLEDLLLCGKISLNQGTQVVKKEGTEIRLTKKEYELLQMLLLNKGTILSREQLLTGVWGIDYEGDERTLDTHIRRLRHKIGETSVKTHIGLGYGMEVGDE